MQLIGFRRSLLKQLTSIEKDRLLAKHLILVQCIGYK
jgi:hypothetical protein